VVRALVFFATAALMPPALRAAEPARPKNSVSDADRQFWAFQKLKRTAIPNPADSGLARSPVDAFLLEKLRARGLSFAPEADKPTLIRRATLDLIGLPPSPADVDAFLADTTPGAYERLVDRLLASPQFGVRWGRMWLDVAGYVDTVGFDVDPDNIIASEGKWRYRDYVIRSFNDDKPYDRFITEQLAGDELVDWRNAKVFTPEIRDLLVATGYLRTAQDFTHEDVGNIPQNHFAVLHDTIEIVGSSLLGLTLNCARCHNHKFDPVPQEDYYRLMAVFTPAYNPKRWKIVFPYDPKLEDRALPDVSPTEKVAIDRHNAELAKRIARQEARIDLLRKLNRDRLLEQKLAAVPEVIRPDVKAAVVTPAGKRNEIQQYLAGKFEASLKITNEEVAAELRKNNPSAIAELEAEIAALNRQKQSYGKIQALYDVGPPPPTFRLVRGNFETPGTEVTPGVVRVLCESGGPELLSVQVPYAGTSGRRLALARWLTAPDTPVSALLARVMINRVWLSLFGKGLVSTPENFGVSGEPPSHPALLEWLSGEYAHNGWRLKPMIRTIVTSTVYRQASQVEPPSAGSADTARAATIDPDNRLLGRMPLKRLDAEVVRDSILAIGGRLDPTMGGPPILVEARPDGTVVIADGKLPTPIARWRRSIYLIARRAFHMAVLQVFDQPVVSTNCPERNRSAVPLQSLTMLNDPLLIEQSRFFADRVAREAGTKPEDRVARAFRLALARDPTAREAAWSRTLLDRQTAVYRKQPTITQETAERKALMHLCHTLLNTSEFLYAP
jgi:hypothetical protein